MASSSLKKTLTQLVDVRREELGRVLPLTSAYGLVIASLYVLKPARNALFLNRLGIHQLPYVLLLVALVGGIAAGIYARFARSVRIDRMILGTFLLLMANLLIFWLILPQGWSWVFYAFYVWVNLYGLTAASLLWLLANSVFNPREARRLFGLIGTGGIAGAILGGIFTRQTVETVGTENLLLVCVGLLGACLVLVWFVRPGEGASHREREAPEGALTSIARSDLLRLLGMTAGLTAVVAAVADVQFNDIANRAFPTKDAKTAFFGEFFAYLNAFVFLFQLLLTPRILRSLGVGAALLFLPLSLALGSLAVLFIPGLWGGVFVKVGDGGFRHSIHRSAAEVLFLPVPSDVKRQTKMFLDATVDNLATGLGAALVLLLTGPLGLAYRHLSLLSLGLIAVWVGLTFRVRGAYVDAFRKAIERRDIDLSELRMNISEASTLNTLRVALRGQNERQLIYALDMLTSVKDAKLTQLVRPLLKHRSAEVRQSAVRALQTQENGMLVPEVEELLKDDDQGVRLEAIYFLCWQSEGDPLKQMRGYLKHPDLMIQSAAVGCIAAYGTPEEKNLIDEKDMKKYLLPLIDQVSVEIAVQKGQELFEQRMESGEQALERLIRGRDAWLRACAIYNVPATNSPHLQGLVQQARNDPDPVVRETAEALTPWPPLPVGRVATSWERQAEGAGEGEASDSEQR